MFYKIQNVCKCLAPQFLSSKKLYEYLFAFYKSSGPKIYKKRFFFGYFCLYYNQFLPMIFIEKFQITGL